MYGTKYMLKTFIVSMVLGAILSIVTALVSTITALILSIPGLKMSRRVRDDIPSYIKESTKGLRRVSTSRKEYDMKTSAPIAEVRADRIAFLIENGLSDILAHASVLQPSRLMWKPEDWDVYLSNIKGLLKCVDPYAIQIHVTLTKNEPTLDSCRVLQMSVQGGIEDHENLKYILDKQFSIEELETVFGLVDLHDLELSEAIRKVALERA